MGPGHRLAALPEPARAVLGLVADLGPLTPGIARLLDTHPGLEDVDATVDLLHGVGVLTTHQRLGTELLCPVPVVASVVLREDRHRQCAPDLRLAAARCYEDEGLPFQAAQCYARLADVATLGTLVAERGPQMLWQGYAVGLVELFARYPGLVRSPMAQRTLAEAHRMAGDNAAAMRAFAPLVEAAARDG